MSIQIRINRNRKFRRNDRCCNNGIYSVEDGTEDGNEYDTEGGTEDCTKTIKDEEQHPDKMPELRHINRCTGYPGSSVGRRDQAEIPEPAG